MSAAPITIEFTPTEADHYRAIRAATSRHPAIRWMTALLAFAPVILIALSMRAGLGFGDAVISNLFWVIAVPVLLLVTGPLALRAQARRAKRAFEEGPVRQRITFDDAGVHFDQAGQLSTLAWSEIRRVLETPHSVLIYVSAREATYFPASAADAPALSALRALFQRHLGDRFESSAADHRV